MASNSTMDSDSSKPNKIVHDHPLAEPADDFELAGREQSLTPAAVPYRMPPPRAPLNLQAMPQPPTSPEPSQATVQSESQTRTLDDFVDHFLSKASGLEPNDDSTPPRKLHPDPIRSDLSDYDRLQHLMTRRAYTEVIVLSHRLLNGSSSHYAPLWQSLLHHSDSSNSGLALESQQQELLRIALCRLQALLKLKQYKELDKELDAWTFAQIYQGGGGNNCGSAVDGVTCPSWVPWSFHMAVATCRFFSTFERDATAYESIREAQDVFYQIRAHIAEDDHVGLMRLHQAIANVCMRLKQWRMVLKNLELVMDHVAGACRQTGSSEVKEDDPIAAALQMHVLSRQGRVLLQAGATAAAANIFQRASSIGTMLMIDTKTHQSPAVALVPVYMAMNEGLLAFAEKQHDIALECFRRASELAKLLFQKKEVDLGDLWLCDEATALVVESPFAVYCECVNNLALCAIYTCRLKESIHLIETLVRDDPTSFLTERVALNLCTLYELQCDSVVAARKKRVLQLLAKRFTLHDIGAECFRLQQ